MDKSPIESIDDILSRLEEYDDIAVAVKNDRGDYTYANEGWSELAEEPIHKITGRSDFELPWGERDGRLILSMDVATRKTGHVKRRDRINHFHKRVWLHTTTERLYVPDQNLIVCLVKPSETDLFCRLANQVSEKGITVGHISLSIKQLYLLHQLLFHIPHKQTARELGCSPNRVNQQLRVIREKFEAEDSKELVCALSAHGLLPLLEHFELLFRYSWISAELRHQ